MIVVVPTDMLKGPWRRVVVRLEIQRRLQTREPESEAFSERLRELAK